VEIEVPGALRDQLKATEILLDRAFGKPEQTLDMNIKDEGERPSAEELIEIRRHLLAKGGRGTGVAEGK